MSSSRLDFKVTSGDALDGQQVTVVIKRKTHGFVVAEYRRRFRLTDAATHVHVRRPRPGYAVVVRAQTRRFERDERRYAAASDWSRYRR